MSSRTRLLFAAPVLLTVALAGCGSSSNTAASAGSGATTPTTSATPTSAATPTTAASGASTSSATVSTASTGLGTVLVNSSGRTLYTFDKDTASSFGCNGGCLSLWPALTASGSPVAGTGVTGTLATRARSDGSQQVTWNGKPLYTYAPDQAPGDTKGDGVGGLWHAARTSAGATTSPTTAAPYGGGNY